MKTKAKLKSTKCFNHTRLVFSDEGYGLHWKYIVFKVSKEATLRRNIFGPVSPSLHAHIINERLIVSKLYSVIFSISPNSD